MLVGPALDEAPVAAVTPDRRLRRRNGRSGRSSRPSSPGWRGSRPRRSRRSPTSVSNQNNSWLTARPDNPTSPKPTAVRVLATCRDTIGAFLSSPPARTGATAGWAQGIDVDAQVRAHRCPTARCMVTGAGSPRTPPFPSIEAHLSKATGEHCLPSPPLMMRHSSLGDTPFRQAPPLTGLSPTKAGRPGRVVLSRDVTGIATRRSSAGCGPLSGGGDERTSGHAAADVLR